MSTVFHASLAVYPVSLLVQNQAKRVLLSASSTNIPIYFAFENAELASIYGDLITSTEFTGAKAILNAGNQVVHQFSVTGTQPQQKKKTKLTVLESSLKGTDQTIFEFKLNYTVKQILTQEISSLII